MVFFKRFGFILFGIFAVADITFLATEMLRFRYYTKPSLLPILLITILVCSSGQKHPISKFLLVTAMLAGTLGDIYLLGVESNSFIYGLICFLIMQLVYCIYFFRMQALKFKNLLLNLLVAVLLFIYCTLLISALSQFLGVLKIPVIIYASVISIMVLSAFNLFHSSRAGKLAIRFFIPGACFLVLSDSILAINKFYLKDDLHNISVMVTYILGQLFLALGFVKHLKSGRNSTMRKKRVKDEDDLSIV